MNANDKEMKFYTLDEMLDKHIGKKGTPEREEFDKEVDEALEEYYLGQSIKDAREAHHLTQEELGKMVGVQKSQISRIERGNQLSFSTIRKIFRALNISASLKTDLGTYPIA